MTSLTGVNVIQVSNGPSQNMDMVIAPNTVHSITKVS